MSHDLILSRAARQFMKKIKDKKLKIEFRHALGMIQKNPHEAGKMKKGDLAGVLGYDFFHNGTMYEIAYIIEEDEEGDFVIVILAGTREQFHEQLKRYIKSSR